MPNSNLALASRYLERHKDSRRFRFTERVLAALSLATDGKQVEYQDTETRGFVCRVSTTARTLYVRRRQRGAGRVVFVRLGVVGDKPLAEYRIAAEAIGAKLADGKSPDTPLPKRGSLTLGGAFDDYLAAKAGHLGDRTIASYKQDFDAAFGSWRPRALESIAADEVARRHRERSLESPARADGALRVLRAIYRYSKAVSAAQGGQLAMADPLALVTAARAWNNVQRRRTRLDDATRPVWLAAVRALPNDKGKSLTGTQRDALLLLSATGLRLREGLRLPWSEVDFLAATISIGAERMKGGRPHVLPLPRRALAMLKARRADHKDDTFVFQSRDRVGQHEARPLDRISRQTFDAIDVKFTPHDLRRTAATWLGHNTPGYVVKRILSHGDPSRAADVTDAYVGDNPDALRPWLQKWEDALYTKPPARRHRKPRP